MTRIPQHSRHRNRLTRASRPAASAAGSDFEAKAAIAAGRCQQRVRTLLGDYVPVPAFADALTSVIMSYAHEYARAMGRIHSEERGRRPKTLAAGA